MPARQDFFFKNDNYIMHKLNISLIYFDIYYLYRPQNPLFNKI